MAANASAKLAVPIDADNASPAAIERLLAEVAKCGTAHVRRAYGDWTGASLRGWKDQLLAQPSPSSSSPTLRVRTPPTR